MRGLHLGREVSKRGVGEWSNRTTLCPFRVFPLMGNGINWSQITVRCAYGNRLAFVLPWINTICLDNGLLLVDTHPL